ncbi:MAG: alpha-glucan family phosphorylase, partial [Clostridia bacterium]|nr:alpha-glucan family phosphorylase [Clostridia bacterium]
MVAYFSAEFGLHESLPIYSGGLGILAGDHLKAASDLNLALVGVGLLYRYGYFVQRMDNEGRQEAEYYYHHFHELPVIPVKGDNGQDLVIGVEMPGRTVWVKIWLVQVGRIRLYLLDTDTGRNCRSDRDITAQLYGGSSDTRLSQELILGLGGVKALRALGLKPELWDINEGHAVLLAVARLREKIQAGQSREAALLEIRQTTLFTTHTPVPAGHDQYGSEMIKFYFYAFCRELKLEPEEFLQWGWNQGQFNLTALAFYLAGRINGVSQLHGRVSQKLTLPWQRKEQKPVFAITNGIHLPSFLAGELKELLGQEADWWKAVDQIADKALWQVHQQLKEKLVQFVRRRVQLQLVRNFAGAEQIAEAENYLDPQIFTLGFARRFATYKRADLLFRDLDRLRNLKYPWQIILAGKAHPADQPGQALLQHLFKLSRQPEWKGKIVFLENYDLEVARYLVQGVDLWLNTPRRPLEASGTSGMKAALNGVLHCSVLDGWWPEAYNGQNGFAFGYSGADLEEKEQDFQDWLALLELLEQQILPLFYARNSDGVPEAWVKMM